jgi:hypothetical protein
LRETFPPRVLTGVGSHGIAAVAMISISAP